MRFGGHETFPLRDGWLHKGLGLLLNDPESFNSSDAADLLGVGNNMAKSIRHWLLGTGLAEKAQKSSNNCRVSDFGEIVWEQDPYLTMKGTWWALHVNLLNSPSYALSWNWLFNHSGFRRFEKAVAIEQLKRYLQYHTKQRPPAHKTLDRDITVLMASYAQVIPNEMLDPEESRDCPFQQLGLMAFFRESGFYRINYAEKAIPSEIFGFALSRRYASLGEKSEVEQSIAEISSKPNTPGKIFCLRPEAVFDLAVKAESELPEGWLQITGQAGTRYVQARAIEPEHWLLSYYQKQVEYENEWLQKQQSTMLAPI